MTEITDKQMREALDRIARTPDGLLLYRYLQKTLCAVLARNADQGALPRIEGGRSFASSLMGHMAKGIRESGRHPDATVTFALAGAVPVARPGGAGRRVTADTPVAGYDAPESAG